VSGRAQPASRSGSPRPAADDPDEALIERFRALGALLEGHFRLSSGLHSPVYVQSALLLQHPAEAARAAEALAARVRAVPGAAAPAVVVAPALGGIVIGYELARALGARAVFAEREGGRMTLRRGFRLEPGEAAVVCEDVVTTGGSAREVAELARAAGARVLAVATLIQRGGDPADLGAPLVTLARLPSPSYTADDCPLCAAGVPAVKPGSRGTNEPGQR
jgi:orotate phosphoribosyltransferase